MQGGFSITPKILTTFLRNKDGVNHVVVRRDYIYLGFSDRVRTFELSVAVADDISRNYVVSTKYLHCAVSWRVR